MTTDATPHLAPPCRLCGKPTTWCGQPDGHKCLNADCPPKDSTPASSAEAVNVGVDKSASPDQKGER